MSISKKLRLGFAAGTLFTIVVGILGVIGMQNLRISGQLMYEQQVVGIEQAGKALSAFENVRLDCRTITIHSFYDDQKAALDVERQFEHNVEQFRELMKICSELSSTDELLLFNEVIMDIFENAYLPVALQIIEKSIADIPDHNNKLHINVMLAHINDISDWIAHLMTGMMELNVAIAEQASIDNESLTLRYIAAQSALLAITAVFAVLVAVYIVRSIMRPVNESVDTLGKIAAGNYEARIEGSYSNEFDKIKNAVNIMAADIKSRELKISGINYASKIQKSMLPPASVFGEAFSDYSVIWEPKDIVSGDIYWIRNFDDGTLLCVCDCTGHGTHGALLTMLAMSAFRTAVDESNYKDPAAIIWELEQRFAATLGSSSGLNIKDGCDLAVVFAGKDGTVRISAGHINIFICDGEKVTRLRGQRIWVGGGTIRSKEEIKSVTLAADRRNKYYIATDGLYEQIGGEGNKPFGYETVERIILEHHHEKLGDISDKIWQAFEDYRGTNQQRDDLSLVTFSLS